MARVTLYRRTRDGVIELRFNHNGSNASRALQYRVEENQWKDGRVVNHPNRDIINLKLTSILTNAQTELLNILNSMPTRRLSPKQIKDLVCASIFNEVKEESGKTLLEAYEEFIYTHERRSTQVVYETSFRKLKEFDPAVTYESVDDDWLHSFERWMRRHHLSVNYISIQERNLKAVFNYARKKSRRWTTCDPFDEYTIDSKRGESRDLTAEEWRKILAYSETASGLTKRYVDMFLLQFLLLGINQVDLHALRPADYKRGRIKYTRMKTGKEYNVKVHTMAAAILDRYKGGEHLLNWCDSVSLMWAQKEENRVLKEMGEELRLSQRMTSYVSRYSWASIAYNDLDISMEVISQALGHSFGLKVTRDYIDINPKKVDEANEQVIAYTFQL